MSKTPKKSKGKLPSNNYRETALQVVYGSNKKRSQAEG